MEENNVDIEKVKQIIQKLKIEILEKELMMRSTRNRKKFKAAKLMALQINIVQL